MVAHAAAASAAVGRSFAEAGMVCVVRRSPTYHHTPRQRKGKTHPEADRQINRGYIGPPRTGSPTRAGPSWGLTSETGAYSKGRPPLASASRLRPRAAGAEHCPRAVGAEHGSGMAGAEKTLCYASSPLNKLRQEGGAIPSSNHQKVAEIPPLIVHLSPRRSGPQSTAAQARSSPSPRHQKRPGSHSSRRPTACCLD